MHWKLTPTFFSCQENFGSVLTACWLELNLAWVLSENSKAALDQYSF